MDQASFWIEEYDPYAADWCPIILFMIAIAFLATTMPSLRPEGYVPFDFETNPSGKDAVGPPGPAKNCDDDATIWKDDVTLDWL